MVSEFTTYLRLGITHIADLQGYDHIAFIVALTAGFQLADWRRLLWLVTAFTVGHSLTLLLATLDVVRVPSSIVEPLIALTIVVAGLRGVASEWGSSIAGRTTASLRAPYAMAGAFGLIHGLGFSGFLRSVLGSEDSLAVPLLGFNVGLEAGQITIVSVVLALGWMCARSGLQRRRWALGLSALAALVGLQMLFVRVLGVL